MASGVDIWFMTILSTMVLCLVAAIGMAIVEQIKEWKR